MKEEMFFSEQELTAARQYWLAQLSGERNELDLQHEIKVVPEGKKENYQLNFPAELSERIFAICKDRDLLLYILLMTVFKLYLFKYSSQDEIIIASPLYSTSDEYYDYNQCIPLIDGLNGEMTFRQLLGQVKNTVIESYNNQHYSIAEILESPGVNNRGFNYMKMVVRLENIHKKESTRDIVNSPANEMTVSFVKGEHGLEVDISYHSFLFNEDTVSGICRTYMHIFDQVLSNREVRLKEIHWFTEAEREKLLFDFNDTDADYPHGSTVVDLFAGQVEKTPHQAVLAFNDHQLTYNGLNQGVNRAARWLRQQGVKPGTFVGMMAIYSVEMIVGIMGILKAGGAYLPIDPGYPAKRINYMLRDAGVEILLALVLPGMLSGVDFNGEIAHLEDPGVYHTDATNPQKINAVNDPAYVIYTSGSTGEPKGVVVEHQSLVNYACWKIKAYGFTSMDKTLQLISLCFDGFGANLYPAILSGGMLVVPDGSRYGDFKYINHVIEESHITHMSVVPIMYRACLENIEKVESIADDPLKSLRMVVLAGEKAGAELIELSLARHKHITLINEYGPTEGTIAVAAYWGVTGEKTGMIGKPAANTKIYILDKTNQLQPIGVPGELCISGTALARGYLNQPELTAEKFCLRRPGGTLFVKTAPVKHLDSPRKNFLLKGTDKNHMQSCNHASMQLSPHHSPHPPITPSPHSPIYLTGDRARWLADGNIELLGRIDQQIKIRGYRVEPQEVEAALWQIGLIKETVVIDKKDAMGNNYLCAYFTANEEMNIAECREMMAGTLPDYMVPSRFIRLETFPLTPNGKLNRKALPEPEQVIDTGTEFVEPSTRIEKDLADVWQRILAVERVGINDNFFELGGNSFLLMQVNTEVEKLYPGSLTITDFFAYPTISQLTGFIDEKRQTKADNKIELETLRLPDEYFHDKHGHRSSIDFNFEISGDLLQKMKRISQKESVELGIILLAVYIYLLAEIIRQPKIVCQTMCWEKGRIIPLALDLTGITNFSEFFRLLPRMQKENESIGYHLQDTDRIKSKKEANAVIPFFYRKEMLPPGCNLLDIYDIVLEVEEENNRLSFACEFSGRLKEEKVEELINMYLKLSRFIIGQCLESSGVDE
jgi:amino acid adenylation domain-containing protein